MYKYPNNYIKTSFLKIINTPHQLEYSEMILNIMYNFCKIDINKEFLNDEELEQLINQSAKFQLALFINDMRNLEELMLYDGKDLKKLSKIEEYKNIEKDYKALTNRILHENSNLLTLKEKGVRENENGYLILNNLIKELVEKKVIEAKSGKPFAIDFQLLIYDVLNGKETCDEFLEKCLEYSRHGNITNIEELKNNKTIIEIRKKQTKKEIIINCKKRYPTAKPKEIAEHTCIDYEYVKKVLKKYNKNLKKGT